MARPITAMLASSVLLLVAGCDRGGGRDEPPVDAATTPDDDLDHLRSMGYVGFTDSTAGPSGVVHFDAARSAPGYNLYSMPDLCRAELIDAAGKVVRSWSDAGCRHWSNVELLENGDLLVTGKLEAPASPGERPNFLLRLDWGGQVVWRSDVPAHHDVERTPRGDLLTITSHRRRHPDVDPAIDVLDNDLTRLDLQGNVLESVSVHELVRAHEDRFPRKPLLPPKGNTEERLVHDIYHLNSVEWFARPELAGTHPLYAEPHVLVCVRRQDRVFLFDWDARSIVWAWGLGVLEGPHDAQLLATGNVLIFDNGTEERGWSRVLEVDPRTDAIAWEFRAPRPEDFYTFARGSCQRLANGNTLIASSNQGEAFEVTPAGSLVWRWFCPWQDEQGRRAAIVRMKRHDPAFIERLLEGSG